MFFGLTDKLLKIKRTEQLNITKGTQGKLRKDVSSDEIISMLKEGKKTSEIAFTLQCSVELVRHRARNNGWKFQKGGYCRDEIRKKAKNVQTKGKRCACCGKNFVPNKPIQGGVTLHLLCRNCWKNGEQKLEGID